jgi:hypothetical protein
MASPGKHDSSAKVFQCLVCVHVSRERAPDIYIYIYIYMREKEKGPRERGRRKTGERAEGGSERHTKDPL